MKLATAMAKVIVTLSQGHALVNQALQESCVTLLVPADILDRIVGTLANVRLLRYVIQCPVAAPVLLDFMDNSVIFLAKLAFMDETAAYREWIHFLFSFGQYIFQIC